MTVPISEPILEMLAGWRCLNPLFDAAGAIRISLPARLGERSERIAALDIFIFAQDPIAAARAPKRRLINRVIKAFAATMATNGRSMRPVKRCHRACLQNRRDRGGCTCGRLAGDPAPP